MAQIASPDTELVSQVRSAVRDVSDVVVHETADGVDVLAQTKAATDLVFCRLSDVDGAVCHERGAVEVLTEGEYEHVADVTDADYFDQVGVSGQGAHFEVREA